MASHQTETGFKGRTIQQDGWRVYHACDGYVTVGLTASITSLETNHWACPLD